MMDRMMGVMVGRLSPEEREQMMMKMMPMMMTDIDMADFMPKMMAAMMPAMMTDILYSDGAADLPADAKAELADKLDRIKAELVSVQK
jgi:hypothetical protein